MPRVCAQRRRHAPSEACPPTSLASMQAVVMAGGGGSRLRPLTVNRPKPMVPLLDKPRPRDNFELLKRHGIEETFVTLPYLPPAIQDSYGDGGGVRIRLR